MKLCLAFVLFLATYLVASTAAQSHNATWGARSFRDSHLSREVIYEKSSFLRKKTRDYVFDQKNSLYPRTITQVVVTDQYTNGKGGYVTLTSGGPRSTAVKLRFTSQRSHGFNFIVDIYGE